MGPRSFLALCSVCSPLKIRPRDTPIVAMTAHALKGDEDRCIAAGMDGYVSKPISSMELFAVMERLLLSNPAVNAVV
jgi:CheY-like chemotaxis protein